MRAVLVLAFCCSAVPGFAQFQLDLAPTRDGSTLYFSQVNPPADPNTRIYRWSRDTGVTLFGDRPDLAEAPPHFGQHLYGTETTYTGAVIYHAEPLCVTGFGPGFNDCTPGETQIVIPNVPPFSVGGFLLISPNGRYGVFTTFNSDGLWVDWFTGEQIAVDFKGQSIPYVIPPFAVNQHAVANNGSFLIGAFGVSGVRVWSKSGETLLQTADQVGAAAISADGSTVALTFRDLDDRVATIPTYVYDLRSGRRTKFPQLVSMSDDGQTVAYLSADISPNANAQAMVAQSDGTGARQVTNVAEGIRSVTLSGDARYLFAVVGNPYLSNRSRIQRYELMNGAVEEISALVPQRQP